MIALTLGATEYAFTQATYDIAFLAVFTPADGIDAAHGFCLGSDYSNFTQVQRELKNTSNGWFYSCPLHHFFQQVDILFCYRRHECYDR